VDKGTYHRLCYAQNVEHFCLDGSASKENMLLLSTSELIYYNVVLVASADSSFPVDLF
jgi:hypothetical protein